LLSVIESRRALSVYFRAMSSLDHYAYIFAVSRAFCLLVPLLYFNYLFSWISKIRS